MHDVNNFTIACKKYLAEGRHIDSELLSRLELENLVTYDQGHIEFCMKDLDWNRIGIQERYLKPISVHWKPTKSKTKFWTKVWYFYTEINFEDPIIIVEWEIDWLSLAHLKNVIWLQGIWNLKKLIEELHNRKVQNIYILTDMDKSSDKAISSLLSFDRTFLSGIYDSRSLLSDAKDVNEYVASHWVITIQCIQNNAKCLGDYMILIDSLIIRGSRWWITINHNKFSQYFLEKYDISTVDGNVFRYQNGIWKILNQHFVQKMIVNEVELLISTLVNQIKVNDKNNIYDLLLSNGYNEDLKYKLQLQESNCINLADWIYNPLNKEIIPYKKEHYKIQKFDYSSTVFDLYQPPQKWLSFLNEILDWYDDKGSIISFLQEFIGYACITHTKFEKALLIYGSWANGKWVFLSIVKDILGKENCAAIWLHEISNPQNIYTLFWKLANIETDMAHNVQLDSSTIKKIISWETMLCKPLYKQPINFWSFAKLFIATNELPFLQSIDNSVRRRFCFIELKKSFYGRENPRLADNIKSERNDIFVWAISGLERLLNRWSFKMPEELNNLLDVFMKDNDSVQQFLDDGDITVSVEGKIHNQRLYDLYKIYCNDAWLKSLGKRKFNKRIRDRWFDDFKDQYWRGFLWLIEKPTPF